MIFPPFASRDQYVRENYLYHANRPPGPIGILSVEASIKGLHAPWEPQVFCINCTTLGANVRFGSHHSHLPPLPCIESTKVDVAHSLPNGKDKPHGDTHHSQEKLVMSLRKSHSRAVLCRRASMHQRDCKSQTVLIWKHQESPNQVCTTLLSLPTCQRSVTQLTAMDDAIPVGDSPSPLP